MLRLSTTWTPEFRMALALLMHCVVYHSARVFVGAETPSQAVVFTCQKCLPPIVSELDMGRVHPSMGQVGLCRVESGPDFFILVRGLPRAIQHVTLTLTRFYLCSRTVRVRHFGYPYPTRPVVRYPYPTRTRAAVPVHVTAGTGNTRDFSRIPVA